VTTTTHGHAAPGHPTPADQAPHLVQPDPDHHPTGHPPHDPTGRHATVTPLWPDMPVSPRPDTGPDRTAGTRPDSRPDTRADSAPRARPGRPDTRPDRTAGTRPDSRPDTGADIRADSEPGRRIVLTPASQIRMRPTRWTWDGRIPAGAITLIPGREGIGKSLTLAWLTAQITRGTLPGIWHGQPRAVIYAATEDSWEHTIGPRLYAAGADLTRVFRVDVESDAGAAFLTLPRDCDALAGPITEHGVAMLAADPLLSLISAGIDTHRDRDLRTALEPLARLADSTGCAVVALAHFNKSASSDAGNLITGSRAFSAVARAVLSIARDPAADDGSCVMSVTKNNLGQLGQSLRYRIEEAEIATDEGPAFVGRLVMLGDTDRSVNDILAESDQPNAEDRAETNDAAAWLTDFLTSKGGEAPRKDVLKAARAEGIADRTLTRARTKAGVTTTREGFAGGSLWRIDPAHAR
jgi:hypothetical protein